uniref:Biogenic amine-like GPCR n=1 Tax=Tripedalia cystophora TaxID=6141 RepID=A0A481ZMQ0_TRICY|nr:biogenic amine-like GPCR [Tripedalia cystophora]
MVDVGVLSTLIITAFAISVINAACLVVIIVSPALKKPSIIFVGNLLMTHLIQGILVIPSYVAKRWEVGNSSEKSAICDVFRFTYMITNYGSCLNLLLIAVDRVLAVFRPYSYKLIVTKRFGLWAVGALWTYVLVLCSFPFIPKDEPQKCGYNPRRIWSVCMLTINTLLPFLLIALSYIFIFKRIKYMRERAFSNDIQKQSNGDRSQESRESSQEITVARMSLTVIFAYAICWGPSFLYYLIQATCSTCFSPSYYESGTDEILTFIMKYLTFIDGIVAPGIYCFKHCYFQMAFRSLKTRFCQRFSQV